MTLIRVVEMEVGEVEEEFLGLTFPLSSRKTPCPLSQQVLLFRSQQKLPSPHSVSPTPKVGGRSVFSPAYQLMNPLGLEQLPEGCGEGRLTEPVGRKRVT